MLQIINVMAVSLDGSIGNGPHEDDAVRRTSGFTNEDDRKHVEALLRTADAVILGANSLKTSGEIWNLRNDKGKFPTWVVLSNAGLPAELPFWKQDEMPRWVVSEGERKGALTSPKVRTLTYGERNPALVIKEELTKIGVERALLFGGAAVNRLFYEAGVVDELVLTLCPLITATPGSIPLVAPPVSGPIRLNLLASETKGDYLFLRYRIERKAP